MVVVWRRQQSGGGTLEATDAVVACTLEAAQCDRTNCGVEPVTGMKQHDGHGKEPAQEWVWHVEKGMPAMVHWQRSQKTWLMGDKSSTYVEEQQKLVKLYVLDS